MKVLIQHDARRAEILPRLLDGLRGLDVEVVTDPGGEKPDPWRCYKECLGRAGPGQTVIIQDDAIVCEDFGLRLYEAVENHKDALVSLFLNAKLIITAMRAGRALEKGEKFVEVQHGAWVPAVALVWPRPYVDNILEYKLRRYTRSDDNNIGWWRSEVGARCIATVPSLVDHPDDVPSLIRGKGKGVPRGKANGRTAIYFQTGGYSEDQAAAG